MDTNAATLVAMKNTRQLIRFTMLAFLVSGAVAGPVALQQPTASYSQIVSGTWTVDLAIDSDPNYSGWAVQHLDGYGGAETAAFQTVQDVGWPGGSLLTFQLKTHLDNGSRHNLGRFRLSVTADDRSQFADGLPTGGNVTANWEVLDPIDYSSAAGALLSKLADSSLLASGTNAESETCTVVARTFLPHVTGVRLETMYDDSLPHRGPGRADNGNFVLVDFRVSADPLGTDESYVVVPGGYATVDGQGGSALLLEAVRIQDIYASDFFPLDSVTIRSIKMRPSTVYGSAFSTTISHFKISMSTTRTSPASPSLTFSNNVGPDETVVFDGPIAVSSAFTGPAGGPKDFDIVIPLAQSFTYDRSKGNLLVEFQNFNGSTAAHIDARGVNITNASRLIAHNPLLETAFSLDYGSEIFKFIYTTNPTAPVILAQPLDQTVAPGSDANFTVTAAGSAPLSYQWRRNGAEIDAATNTTLLLANVQVADAGSYSVVVSNSVGVAISSDAVLVVTNLTSLVVPGGYANVDGHGGSALLFEAARIQDIYASDFFPPFPVTIRSLKVRPSTQYGSAFSATISHFKISMSTTLVSPAAPSLTFSNNIGPDETVVLDGPIAVSSAFTGPAGGPKDFDIFIPLSQPFTYDSTKGNLLMEFRNFNGSTAAHIDARGVNITNASRLIAHNPLLETAFSLDYGSEIFEVLYSSGPSKPVIIAQPQSQTVLVGSNAIFSVTADGTPPLYYQWRLEEVEIQDATNAVLSLSNAQHTQAGRYSVVITNALGSTTSSDALLTVLNPPALVQFLNVLASSGGSVGVPVQLVANGDENALGFSLQFDSALLHFTGAGLAGGVPDGATLLVNDGNAASGRLGLAVALPAGGTFPAGTQQVITVGFDVAPVLNPVNIALTMSDQPTTRQVSDTHAAPLPAVFQGGNIDISRVDFEGDVAPRPGGDHALTIIDWVQLGRFVAGLDSVSDAEFQRADCAPRATLGNGVISITDWVQAGRYAAGLDPITPVGGPVLPAQPAAAALARAAFSLVGARTLVLPQTNILPGTTLTFGVRLEAQGDENALGFSLAFDSARLQFLGAAKAAATSNAVLNLNSNQAAAGKLGLALALPAGATLGAGAMEAVLLTFGAASNASGMAPISFSDQPIAREVSDALANPLPAVYDDGAILVGAPRPTLGLTRTGSTVLLFWPTNAAGFVLQATSGPLGTAWTNVEVIPLEFGGQKLVPLPTTGSEKYFRLRQP